MKYKVDAIERIDETLNNLEEVQTRDNNSRNHHKSLKTLPPKPYGEDIFVLNSVLFFDIENFCRQKKKEKICEDIVSFFAKSEFCTFSSVLEDPEKSDNVKNLFYIIQRYYDDKVSDQIVKNVCRCYIKMAK